MHPDKASTPLTNVVSPRSEGPGDFSVENGRIVFPTFEDYEQTVDYLASSSEEDVDEWRGELTIVTAASGLATFDEATCCDSLTLTQIDSIVEEYADYVKIHNVDDTMFWADLKYQVHPEIVNLDGEFQIEDVVYKQAGNRFFSITNTSQISPSEVTESTDSSQANGLFYVTMDASALSGGCCPSAHYSERIYGNNPRRKLTRYYAIQNWSFTQINLAFPQFSQFRYIIIPEIYVDIRGRHLRERRFWFVRWWTCDRTNLEHVFNIDFNHSFSTWCDSPITLEKEVSHENQCNSYIGQPVCRGFFESNFGAAPNLFVCVNEVYQLFTNTNNSQDIEYDCQ